jgi:hypothetical protein
MEFLSPGSLKPSDRCHVKRNNTVILKMGIRCRDKETPNAKRVRLRISGIQSNTVIFKNGVLGVETNRLRVRNLLHFGFRELILTHSGF